MNSCSVSPDQVRWFRMKRSGLVDPFPTPEAAASALVGIQAQIEPFFETRLLDLTILSPRQ